MFDQGLFDAIQNREFYYGKLDLLKESYPDWNQMIPFWDDQIRKGNKRAENPLKIFSAVYPEDFPFVRYVKDNVFDPIENIQGFSTHCYAGITPNAFASPVHRDKMDVLFVVMQGTVPWRVFANGYDPNSDNNKSTFSRRLVQGEYVYMPAMMWHAAFPDESRIAFSFGWDRVPENG